MIGAQDPLHKKILDCPDAGPMLEELGFEANEWGMVRA